MILIVGLLLALKHFICDGPLQTAYQYLNKGNLRHVGGYLHAGLHGLSTTLICAPFGFWWLGIVDAVIHYGVDWTKVNLTKTYAWSAFGKNDTGKPCLQIFSDWYFYALIADQCLHFATYMFIIWIVVK